ncbi:MAG TPA: hypothetical protein VKI19_15615 [Acidimicrobiales bacterium]|nr:hypothetical protein [Acidimicrobiales bacterium]
MPHSPAIRSTRAGSLGRAEFDASGYKVTLLVADPAVTATAALAARRAWTADRRSGASGPFGDRAGAADHLAAAAAAPARCGVLVSVGGDVATTGPAPAGGWRVRIVGGGIPRPASLRLSDGGLATAHSTDPGAAWRSVTVAAQSCRQAFKAAAAAVRRGAEAERWIAALGLPARLVAADGTVHCTGPWPSDLAAA